MGAVTRQIFRLENFPEPAAGESLALVEQHQLIVMEMAMNAQPVAVDHRLQMIIFQAGI
jgi:hypothetical protein